MSFFRRLINDNKPFVLEKRYVKKDGSTVWVTNSVSPVFDESGQLAGAFAVVVDNSERKAAEKVIQKNLEDLARSNAELARFAYVASHDLKEPLRVVRNYVQLLERNCGHLFNAEAKEYMEYIAEGTKRMHALIADLLAYASVDHSMLELKLTDCNEVLSRALDSLKAAIEESSAQIVSDHLPSVWAEGSQLLQLFQNLIANAVKFRRKETSPFIRVSVKERHKDFLFTISDNGIGVAPNYYERIFVLFQRLHDARSYPGTGLGLAICKKIIDRHGGKIWVESQVGEGSSFLFTLPKRTEKH